MKRWLVWGAFLAFWTIALETPVPDTGHLPGGEFIMTNRMVVAKTIHVTMYALLAYLTGNVSISSRYRVVLMFLLMGHATVTELIQEVLQPHFHRGGSLMDVGFDHFGIALGFLLNWKRWTRADRVPAAEALRPDPNYAVSSRPE